MDTPGFGSEKEVIVHMAGIFAAITGKPLNGILILTKYERFENMRKDITENMKLLSRYREMITVVITHWDNAENDPAKQLIGLEELKKSVVKEVITPLGLKNVIYSGSQTTGESICKTIDQILIRTIKQKIELTKTEFENQFATFITLNKEIEIKTQELEDEFGAQCQAAIHFIDSQNEKTSDVAELMHELILALKKEANETVEKFEQRHGYDCLKLLEQGDVSYETAYLTHTKLKHKVLIQLDNVIRRAQNKMTNYPAHIYNFIKQCPNCKIIWLKVSGCGGQTSCGNFPDSDNIEFKPQAKKFKINITKTTVECIRLKQQTEINQKYSLQQNKQKLKGCGAVLVWDNLPILSTDILDELKNTGVLDLLSMHKNGVESKKNKQDLFWSKLQYEAQKQLNNLENASTQIMQPSDQKPKIVPQIIYRNEDGSEHIVQKSNEQKSLQQQNNQLKYEQVQAVEQQEMLKIMIEMKNTLKLQEKKIQDLNLQSKEQQQQQQNKIDKDMNIEAKKKQNQKNSCAACIIS
ncbi:unnamed protein product (macronuclear) [Paramecium tetraurelia]|uniref:AIG1-type G domain-containing protein n=1 Tax=Paramecium tetraurelia TaxID=5888 RepID=A0EE46_PARTE|nr:uncharacterized protein GSPATT00025907001 [Paramecium tetraurelia]CAK93563.1 unnamed protein product [Paramecium tetraurelia]|eukprot:XP_001460960.1 hypothetical protein (macronuclear) [Paramecium tetraurelia strain d4-2]